jgi:hypothetical protein
MENLTCTYPYLILSLFLLIFALLALALCPRSLRLIVLLSGIFSIPSSLASLDFVPSYWDPVRVAELWIGPEDAIFSFSTGILAFVMALWPIRKRIHIILKSKLIILRLVSCYLYGILLNLFMIRVLRFDIMPGTLLTIAIIGFSLAWFERTLIILCPYGILCFTFFYTLILKIGFWMSPEFLDQWNLPALCGISPLGIPLEEIAWAAACGAVWPMITGFIFGLRIPNVSENI